MQNIFHDESERGERQEREVCVGVRVNVGAAEGCDILLTQ